MEALVVSPSEARKMLVISSNRMYEMLESGELPAYKEGTSWKIPVQSLKHYITQRAEEESRRRRNEKVQMEQTEV